MIRTRLGQVFGAAKALVTKPLASNRRKAQDAEKCRWTQENVETSDEPTRRGYPAFVLLEQVGSLRVFVKLYPTWRVVCTVFSRVSGHRSQ